MYPSDYIFPKHQTNEVRQFSQSFRPPFSKGGTDPTPWGVGRPSQRATSPYWRLFLIAFSLRLLLAEKKRLSILCRFYLMRLLSTVCPMRKASKLFLKLYLFFKLHFLLGTLSVIDGLTFGGVFFGGDAVFFMEHGRKLRRIGKATF